MSKIIERIIVKAASVALCLLSAGVAEMYACTSVIVSGRVTADGRPLMLKVRDQSEARRNTTVEFFEGEKYDFLGMVGDASKPHDKIKSFVGGYNTAGFCIMSLTAHGFPLDTVRRRGGVLTYAPGHPVKYAASKYFNVKNVQMLIGLSRKTEGFIDGIFCPEYEKWASGSIRDGAFYSECRRMMPMFYGRFRDDFKDYLK